MLSDGETAPDFVLPGTDGEDVRRYALVDELRRGPVVLSFYQFDFHPVCTEHLRAVRDLDAFSPDPTVLAVSTDSAFSHRAYAREHGLGFPLLSDDTGTVSDTYGVLTDGVAAHGVVPARAVFVIDADWTVRCARATDDPGKRPDLGPVRDALAALTDG